MLKAREAVRTVPSYHPPLAGREGLRLDFNENTSGCSPRVLDRLRNLDPEELAKYPERGPVEALVAQFLKVSASEVLLTNGVDEAIHLLCETYLEPGNEALIVVPTYSMYRIYATAAGAEVVSVSAGQGLCISRGRVDAAHFGAHAVDLHCESKQSNGHGGFATRPAGDCAGGTQSRHAGRRSVFRVLRQNHDRRAIRVVERVRCSNFFEGVWIGRLAFGSAGRRRGTDEGDASGCFSLQRECHRPRVSARCSGRSRRMSREYVSEVLEGRRRLEAFLHASGISFWTSEANFILMRVGPSKADAAKFVAKMRNRGILVRDRSGDPGCEGCVRITLGLREQVDRLLDAMPEALEVLGASQGARS